jgi:hypothetical protein
MRQRVEKLSREMKDAAERRTNGNRPAHQAIAEPEPSRS